jgi:hypothetical protein
MRTFQGNLRRLAYPAAGKAGVRAGIIVVVSFGTP